MTKGGILILSIGQSPWGTGVCFGDWSSGTKFSVFPKTDRHYSKKELSERNKSIAKKQRELERIRQEKEHKAAQRAFAILDESVNVIASDHPYLRFKRVLSFGLKRTSKGYVLNNLNRLKVQKNSLLIPMTDIEGSIRSLQFISPTINKDGRHFKMFLPNGCTRGALFQIGKVQNRILLCEGYATGSSIHMATGETVIVCFTASNLLNVARLFKSKHPDKELIVCADNDAFKEINIGIVKAIEVMRATGAGICFPIFKNTTTKTLAPKPTDFNDLFILEGVEAVREQTNRDHIIKCHEHILTALSDVAKASEMLKLSTNGTSSNYKYNQEYLKKLSSVLKDVVEEIINKRKASVVSEASFNNQSFLGD